MSGRTCILHFGVGSQTETIINFTDETLNKCKQCFLMRGDSSKYKHICLPDDVSPEIGYHTKCYSNFTAIQMKKTEVMEIDNLQSADIRINTSDVSQDSSADKCIFCCQKEKKHNGKRRRFLSCSENDEYIQKLSIGAATINDSDMSEKIKGLKRILYHKLCLVAFEKKIETSKNLTTKKPKDREIKETAYELICDFIQENVIEREESYLMTYLFNLYTNFCNELWEFDEQDINCGTVNNLETKIMKRFEGRISKHSKKGRHGGNIIFSSNIKIEDAIRKTHDLYKDEYAMVREVAFILRSEILKAAKNNSKPLPPNLSPKDVINGELEIPLSLLTTFYEELICGSNKRKGRNEKQLRKVKSFSDSTIYAVTNGDVKPSTLLQVGLTVKSLTSSKKLIQILNRLGYSVNYDCVEELETELAYTYMQQKTLTPPGISKSGKEFVGVAWDNYDSYVDTQTGKGTMHDTVGICFQNKVEQRIGHCEVFDEQNNQDVQLWDETYVDDQMTIRSEACEEPSLPGVRPCDELNVDDQMTSEAYKEPRLPDVQLCDKLYVDEQQTIRSEACREPSLPDVQLCDKLDVDQQQAILSDACEEPSLPGVQPCDELDVDDQMTSEAYKEPRLPDVQLCDKLYVDEQQTIRSEACREPSLPDVQLCDKLDVDQQQAILSDACEEPSLPGVQPCDELDVDDQMTSEAYKEPRLPDVQLCDKLYVDEQQTIRSEACREPSLPDVQLCDKLDVDQQQAILSDACEEPSLPGVQPCDELDVDDQMTSEAYKEPRLPDVQLCDKLYVDEQQTIRSEACREPSLPDVQLCDKLDVDQQQAILSDACEEPSLSGDQPCEELDDPIRQRRRRTLPPSNLDIVPYKKKPKMTKSPVLIPLTDIRRDSIPDTYYSALLLEKLWLFSLINNKSETPMWVGWNSKLSKDNLSEHVITYLTQINRSPTAYDVVAETMRRTLAIAEECHQKCIIVTYDLAIAKMAFQIQSEDSPTYDNLFIMLGPFHITMAFFKAIGKYIDCSGAADILIDSGLLAEGSVNGFILGTHYNRCKKLHTFLAAAMSILHFQKYSRGLNIEDDLLEEIEDTLTYEKWMEFKDGCDKRNLRQLLEEYDSFSKKTQNGDHGKTAQFWYNYVKLIELFHLLSRSVRSGDYKLYTYVIGKMCNIFFAMNQPNYARWLTKMHSNMCAMDETHPEIVEQFEKGALSLRRTSKHFARSAIDLTLEQTVNADAASSSRGVTTMTNSILARQRWAMTHTARTYIMSDFLDKLGLTKKEDVTPDLRASNMTRNQKNLDTLIEKNTQSMNPFGETLHENNLHNIVTGRTTSETTMNFLLNVDQEGEDKKNKFINECEKDPSRFEKPITRTKMKTFADEIGKIKEKKKDGMIVELKLERNFMGRLLCLAVENNIDLKETLKYPITPVPLAFSHLDATFVTTNKSVLLRALEKKIESGQPSQVTTTVVDGMFLLHTLGDLPLKFGDIARHILIKLMKLDGKNIHVVFDRTITPSIKDCERDRRSMSSDRLRPYAIMGSNTKRPNNFMKALRNDHFKKALVAFLAKEWEKNHYASIISNKKLYVTNEENCYSYRSNGSSIQKELKTNLCCSFEEADSRMFFHIAQTTSEGEVVIRSNDTDVLVIALANKKHLPEQVHLWLEMGLPSKNSHRYIDVNKLYEDLGPKLSNALTAFHAFTGCDYIPAFYGKGKSKPLEILEKNEKAIEAFRQLGENAIWSNSNAEKDIEKFVCQMYGMSRLNSVNEARYQKFLKAYKPTQKSAFGNIKGIDERTLPPCHQVVKQQILRTNFICGTWNHAHIGKSISDDPLNQGWILKNDKYTPVWFKGDRIPSTLEAVSGSESNLADQEIEDEDDNVSDQDDVDESDNESNEIILGI